MIAPVLAADASRARKIEEAALRAWPALEESDFDGWRLRFANGYTRRSNSVTPLEPSRLALADKVATCERLYAARDLPTIFRLTPFAPEELDALLAARGYRAADQVEVRARALTAPTARPAGARPVDGTLRVHTVDPWLEIFDRLSGASPANRGAHRAVLENVPGVRRLLAWWVGGVPVACGMGVVVDDRLGLFDLVTGREHRHRGYGSEMLRRVLRWGARERVSEAYLQVLADNAVARRIYERFGFEPVYRYHYREKHAGSAREG